MNEITLKKAIRLSKRYIAHYNPIKKKECCICNNKISSFLTYKGGWKAAPQILTALKVIGSDLDNFACPVCNSNDRERHQWLYWQFTHILFSMQGATILHFAPEFHLSKKIIDQKPLVYIRADLYPSTDDIRKIDILSMPFADNEFDILIANHVLEHVSDLNKALLEIHRVLKPNGWAILQTPYSESLENTWEDCGIQTEHERYIAYGQEDHVRLFGKNIFHVIETLGFKLHLFDHAETLGNINAYNYGVNQKEPFMLFKNIKA